MYTATYIFTNLTITLKENVEIDSTSVEVYTVFHKRDPFLFFHNSLKWWSIYTKCLLVVGEKILIQNIATKYGSWLNILC